MPPAAGTRPWSGRFVVLVAALLATVVGAPPASAHDATGAGITVSVVGERVLVTAPVAFAQLGFRDTSNDGLLDAVELAEQEAAVAGSLVSTVRDHVRLSVDGRAVELVGAGARALSETGDAGDDSPASPYVELLIASARQDGQAASVELEWGFDSPSGTVVLTHPGGAVTSALADDGGVAFTLDAWTSATSFLGLGVDHIRYGPDHLLFLIVLTLAVAGATITRETIWRMVALVTAFTLGHAVSFALAFFDVVSVPAAVVEPAIALSIVAAALLALRGRASDARPWLAGLIGLVHGLGFASSLSSLGVGTSQRVVAVATFNLGIDIAQTIVVLLAIGALWLSGRALGDGVVWVRRSVAAGAAVVGLVWTVSRVAELMG